MYRAVKRKIGIGGKRMETFRKPDLIINGVSSGAGGDYGKVNIEGIGTIEGNVSALEFDVDGITKVRGNLLANELDCDGILKVEGQLSAGKSVIDGKLKVLGSMKGEFCRLNGTLNVGGDCELENFDAEGAFDVSGLLNAGRITVRLHGKGIAREIGVEFIQVRQARKNVWSKLWRWMLPRFTPELQVATIEGDDIDLEHTVADVVRGNRIVIGKGCIIGRVEYQEMLKVHPGAKVEQEVKTSG
jgi:cytoskeletal protein CcmA (bactofilin family)